VRRRYSAIWYASYHRREDNFAGVHENLKPMPRELQVQAQKDMAFFGVQGKRLRPAHVAPIFASDVSAEHAARSTDIFSASVQEVQQKVGGEGSEVGPRIFEPTGSVFSNPARTPRAHFSSSASVDERASQDTSVYE
jgi:hypothetical protein